MTNKNISYWTWTTAQAYDYFKTNFDGLSSQEVKARQNNLSQPPSQWEKRKRLIGQFFKQFTNPIYLLMLSATLIALFSGEVIDSLIIFLIVLASTVLSFWQETGAELALTRLKNHLKMQALVKRDQQWSEQPISQLVLGDIVKIATGSIIPADGLIIESSQLSVNQAALTGESWPETKDTKSSALETAIGERSNCVYQSTVVTSGSGLMLVTALGKETFLGQLQTHLDKEPPLTDFERGIRDFGVLMSRIMLSLTSFILVVNLLFERPFLTSLLFSVALAVGLTPQLLPAIVNITLSRGSLKMAKHGVLVRHLTSLENLGSLTVLCTDKTGTLTAGVIKLDRGVNALGLPDELVLKEAYLNASLQSSYANPLDQAIMQAGSKPKDVPLKMGELAFDFSRQRQSVIVQTNQQQRLICKGAVSKVLPLCVTYQNELDQLPLDQKTYQAIEKLFNNYSAAGFRVLALANRFLTEPIKHELELESKLNLLGFLLFYDPPKAGVKATIKHLENLGIELKIITGDNLAVSQSVAQSLKLPLKSVITGQAWAKLTPEQQQVAVLNTTIFAEVDPLQKEQIILSLKKQQKVVGYLGDGINDAVALHAADVGISVKSAVSVAKEAADLVLLEKSLAVLSRGIEIGRTAFINTQKYLMLTLSANFGNIISLAGAALFLPFLPLLPKQLLLINFLTDLPVMLLTQDEVLKQQLAKPVHFDLSALKRVMFSFGLISTLSDYLTFFILLVGLQVSPVVFQTSWFVLSVLTELVQLLIMRSTTSILKQRLQPILLAVLLGVAGVTIYLPFSPLAVFLDLVPLSTVIGLTLILILIGFSFTMSVLKYFYDRPKPI